MGSKVKVRSQLTSNTINFFMDENFMGLSRTQIFLVKPSLLSAFRVDLNGRTRFGMTGIVNIPVQLAVQSTMGSTTVRSSYFDPPPPAGRWKIRGGA